MLGYKEITLRLFLALVLSTLVGINRESIKKPAGLRTHVLVCIGSTLVMLLSVYIFENYKWQTNLQPDRLGSQVISGIGFLGAGTILREGNKVKGLTTAASLWTVACIGLAIGAGFYFAGILATLLVLMTLITYFKLGKKIKIKDKLIVEIISIEKPGQLGKIYDIVEEFDVIIENMGIQSENGLMEICLDLIIQDEENRYEILNKLATIDDVVEISQKY